MRISDWSSDVCSSDLAVREALVESGRKDANVIFFAEGIQDPAAVLGTTRGLAEACGSNRVIVMPVSENGLTGVAVGAALLGKRPEIGRASGRERGWPYVLISVVAVALNTKHPN